MKRTPMSDAKDLCEFVGRLDEVVDDVEGKFGLQTEFHFSDVEVTQAAKNLELRDRRFKAWVKQSTSKDSTYGHMLIDWTAFQKAQGLKGKLPSVFYGTFMRWEKRTYSFDGTTGSAFVPVEVLPESGKTNNLSSDLQKPPSDLRFVRVNAGELQRDVIQNGTSPLKRLPMLGVVEQSPIIRGFSHLLSAYPKTGKTELLARLASEWSAEGLRVLYVTEEPQRIWAARLQNLPLGFDTLDLVFALGMTAPDIKEVIASGDDDVVVIDTIRLLGFNDEKDNSEIFRVLAPIIKVCRDGDKTCVFAHHNRKGGGEYGEAASGGHVFLGIVDIGIEVQRDPHATNRRLVKTLGRVIDVPDVIYELQSDGTMKMLGDPHNLEFQQVKHRVIEQVGPDWQSTKEIRQELLEPKPSVDQLTNALNSAASEGTIERDPPIAEGAKKGKTYRWRKT